MPTLRSKASITRGSRLILALCFSAGIASPQAVTTLQLPALDINSVGQVLVQDSSSWYLRNIDGSLTPLTIPNGTPGVPDGVLATWQGLNSSGTIVGSYAPPGGFTSQGFVRTSAGQYTIFSVPGAASTAPIDINDLGVVVGTYVTSPTSGGPTRGFLRDASGQIQLIDIPGYSYTLPQGVNNQGQISGWVYDPISFARRGFILTSTNATPLLFDLPGAMFTYAHHINNLGEVAGESSDGVAFIRRSNGSFQTVSIPGAIAVWAYAINENGQDGVFTSLR
jgi:hypothetical protein